jgi:hypothetical protein
MMQVIRAYGFSVARISAQHSGETGLKVVERNSASGNLVCVLTAQHVCRMENVDAFRTLFESLLGTAAESGPDMKVHSLPQKFGVTLGICD